MDFSDINARGMVLLGCGRMGSAMLQGWLERGIEPRAVWIMDPHAPAWVQDLDGIHINADLPENPAIVLLAVKPQLMAEAIPTVTGLGGGDTVFVSVAAGTPISYFEDVLGADTPIVRAMPNTPAAVGRGITALIGNGTATADQVDLADALLQAVGQTVRLQSEDQMDAVTAVSGSGPAYVFHLIETLAAAGAAQGLSVDLALQLAKATVAGAGALAEQSPDGPDQLRINVTSPGGTTATALNVLMDAETGFPSLLDRAVTAAADRSRELGK